MTLTIKLDPALEKALNIRSAAQGLPKSNLVREALRIYLSNSASPYELGRDLFGRHTGPSDLASKRKNYLVGVLNEKRRG